MTGRLKFSLKSSIMIRQKSDKNILSMKLKCCHCSSVISFKQLQTGRVGGGVGGWNRYKLRPKPEILETDLENKEPGSCGHNEVMWLRNEVKHVPDFFCC